MTEARHHSDVVCPFCPLACDDLDIEAAGTSLGVASGGCPLAEAEFARPLGDPTPLINGAPASLEAAIGRAAELLRASRLPLYGGLGTDTGGARAVLALAEATGGVLDHAAAGGLFANLRAMQDAGWVTATLAEARNRPDLMLFIGPEAAGVAPQLRERLLAPGPRLVGDVPPTLLFLGPEMPADAQGEHLPCPPEALPLMLAVLDGLVAQRPVPALAHGVGVELASLAERLRAARYALVVWSAGELPGPHADLLVGRIASMLRTLNATTRAAGLPLAGFDNVIGVNQVCAWQTGVPLRTSLASGAPDHDAWRFVTDRLLAEGAVDCLLWLTSFRGLEPPGGLPSIVLARSGCAPSRPVEVLIPVGTPGLDHAGSIYRTDAVVSLPLRRLRDSGLPSAALVLDGIRKALG